MLLPLWAMLACRYGTYKLVQKMPGGENMVGFTRILHRTQPDAVMDEVRTCNCTSSDCNPSILANPIAYREF